MSPEKRSKIVAVIKCLRDSYDSHLDFSVKENKSCSTCGDRKFQAKTLKEYEVAIGLLTDLLQ